MLGLMFGGGVALLAGGLVLSIGGIGYSSKDRKAGCQVVAFGILLLGFGAGLVFNAVHFVG